MSSPVSLNTLYPAGIDLVGSATSTDRRISAWRLLTGAGWSAWGSQDGRAASVPKM